MPAPAQPSRWGQLSKSIDRLGQTRPDVVLLAPYMVYLLLLGLASVVPPTWEWLAIAIRGVGSLAVVWALRRHLPAWGKPYWTIALLGGLAAAYLWYAGQYLFDWIGLGGRLPIYPGEKVVTDPRDVLGARGLFHLTVTLRIIVAITAVPIVEELFWRAFLLRWLIDRDNFERVPLGKFTWFSFLGTSLLSTVQHPDNWAVSIFCWMLFNALFYWTRSIMCLVLVHALTNLLLYLYVLKVDDWAFW
jgi:CAAX prenyl protease-like protein